MRWCTVTVTDQDGRRHSVDVQATSTFDAAHLFVVEAKKERAVGLPKPTLATVFEVVAAGKVYRVTGTVPAIQGNGDQLQGLGLYRLRGKVKYPTQATSRRSSVSRVRENRTHGLKGDS